MNRTLLKAASASMAVALVAIACGEPATSPIAEGLDPNFDFGPDGTPGLEEFEVCKVGTSANFDWERDGVAQPGFSLNDGECRVLLLVGGSGANVEVRERVEDFTNEQLDSLRVATLDATGSTDVVVHGTDTHADVVGGAGVANGPRGVTVTFYNSVVPVEPGGAVLLIIDEDGIDNGLHLHKRGGAITPNGPHFWKERQVNDDKPGEKQRDVLRFFRGNNIGRVITVVTGQTDDEGWFAPNCIPRKWLGGNKENNTCMTEDNRTEGINRYFGLNGERRVPNQDRLDKIPNVMPLRALGINSLIGKDVCAVVYDSDISINYDHDKPLGVNGNLQGETYGIAAFTVNAVNTLNGFSSSTLPQVQITINDPATCTNFELFNAPVPNSSSVPNDRIAPGSPNGYKRLMVYPSLPTFY